MKLIDRYPVYLEILGKNTEKYRKTLEHVISYFYESYGGFPVEAMEPVKIIAVAQGKTDSIDNMFKLLEKPQSQQAEMLTKVLNQHEKYRTAFLVNTGANIEYNDSRLLKHLKDLTSSKILPKHIKYMDIGPSKGKFSSCLLRIVRKTGKNLKPTLVDARQVDVSENRELDKISKKVGFYDVITGKHPDTNVKELLEKQHLIVCKQVLKFHRKKSAKALGIFKKHMDHGAILVTGGPYRKYHKQEEQNKEVIVSPQKGMLDPFNDRTVAKIFVKVNGKEPMLVKVNTRDFLKITKKLKTRKSYLADLHKIVERTAAEKPKRAKGKVITYKENLRKLKR